MYINKCVFTKDATLQKDNSQNLSPEDDTEANTYIALPYLFVNDSLSVRMANQYIKTKTCHSCRSFILAFMYALDDIISSNGEISDS